MTGFLIAAVLLTAGALLFVLPVLLRANPGDTQRARHDELNLAVLRDQSRELDADLAAGAISAEAHKAARDELARRVAEDVQPAAQRPSQKPQRALALGIAMVLPALAAALYFQVGNPVGVNAAPPAAVVAEEGHEVGDAEIAAMVQGLADRLAQTPNDAEGWYMLARSYSALGRFGDAAQAYARLEKLLPNDADVLADYADALATAQGASLKGEPERLVVRALEIDPKNVKALALSGSAAYERGDDALAEAQWQKLLPLVPADSDFARSTQGSIAQARARARGERVQAPTQAPVAAGLSGTVELDPALKASVAPGDTVFIFARAVDGPRFPLAVLRKKVSDLPLRFTLDDSMSMAAGATLSAFPQVIVGARISKSGSATPAPGDPAGSSAPVASNAQGVAVRIVQAGQ